MPEKKKKREKLTMEQLEANYKEFIKGKKTNTDGRQLFEKAIKNSSKAAKKK